MELSLNTGLQVQIIQEEIGIANDFKRKVIKVGRQTHLGLILPGEPGQFHLWPGIGQGS